MSSNVIKLKLPASFRIHDVINVSQVQPYKPPVAGQSSVPPELIDIEENPKYEVEEILDSRLKHGKLEYLIKWSGYTIINGNQKPIASIPLILLVIFIERILLLHKSLQLGHSLD